MHGGILHRRRVRALSSQAPANAAEGLAGVDLSKLLSRPVCRIYPLTQRPEILLFAFTVILVGDRIWLNEPDVTVADVDRAVRRPQVHHRPDITVSKTVGAATRAPTPRHFHRKRMFHRVNPPIPAAFLGIQSVESTPDIGG